MCNCNNNISLCSRCSTGLSCGCPPDYNVLPLPVDCGCCPPDYDYIAPTANFPNGYCKDRTVFGITVATIPCTTCEDAITTDCVIYPGTATITCNGAGIAPGDNLTTILSKMCASNPPVILAMLQAIALDTTYGLKAAFCQISNFCSGIPGSTTPYIGPITFTIP